MADVDQRKENGMGILDKAKAAAGKVAEEAKKGTAQVQDKVEQAQTRKKADALAEQLGYLIVRERSGGEAAGAEADRLVGEIQALESKLAEASEPTPGDGTPE
jgi:hypothetical protein